VVAGAGVLVLALVGGVTYGVGALSGGGSQPESALPGGAVGFLKVDLDPSAGQKVNAFRFMRQFPALKDRLGGDDLRKIAFEAVADSAGWDDIDFARDVAPWMGERMGVAVYERPESADGEDVDPDVVLALRVSDESGAREGLRNLVDAAQRGTADAPPPGFVVDGDYALLALDQAKADQAAKDAGLATLDQDSQFSADLEEAADGVLTAWVDATKMGESLGSAATLGGMTGMNRAAQGRSTIVARFDGPDAFEIVGTVHDLDAAAWTDREVTGLDTLPASSVFALGIADGDELVDRTYKSIRTSMKEQGGADMDLDAMVADAERQLGIDIPSDIGVLLGDNLVGALDGGSDSFDVGARVSTDAARAEQVLDALTKASGGALPLVRERAGDDLVVASSQEQADRLAKDGTLGEKASFTKALPDLDGASFAAWVDVQGLLAGNVGGMTGADPDPNLEPLQGVGVSAVSGDNGSATFRLRVVTN
jgi:hypothetical protein